ncbi:hybrid sensor histidine kinase/response regulator [Massilia antarctica]|uniref:hybrid sensor histidine kinase/response regulator n=1 Tax=Massilia antarctica TaxID=2765360 RepID=UPI0006BB572B|nr:hybrid sensor histidine kinase/response regulator [Massilia sp. H27-R4]MCY0910663.1 hybrid sensor histidine kinase/response regulator [Massilia sp. H27-R4]CUI08968.1 Chemotaxis protein methyltransferase CheR [Janthinobacterium sp. CG23_2]CUU32754.1 Chemotaxis protein methyltransferase CheR [Janthinobacterium sp. CG23_2]
MANQHSTTGSPTPTEHALTAEVDGLRLLLAQREAEIAALRDDAAHAGERRNAFLALLAHELRNPLAPISLANTMLAKLPEPSAGLLNVHAVIHRQVQHLTRLLDELLDAASLNSGTMILARSPAPLVALLRRALQTVQVRILERHQQLLLDMPEELTVNADPVRLAQAFANLLVNASKYTGDGGIIRVAARAHEGRAVVTVADNGAGMEPGLLACIFDPFTQGPRTPVRSEGGLGVGLNVVRMIVELHDGKVVGASDGPGRGSVFTVSLPLLAGDAGSGAPLAGAARIGRRILLVEDNLDANDTLGQLLLAEGHDVTAAYDGIAGLSLARTQVFDVLICDINLPGLDGYELITQLRRTAGAHIPFAIAISGYGRPADRTRAIAAGFGQYVVKPLDIDALLALVASEAVTACITAASNAR